MKKNDINFSEISDEKIVTMLDDLADDQKIPYLEEMQKRELISEEEFTEKVEIIQHEIDVEKRKIEFENFSSIKKYKIYFIEGFLFSAQAKKSEDSENSDDSKKKSFGGGRNNVLTLSLIMFPLISLAKLVPKGSSILQETDVIFFILFNIAMLIGGLYLFPFLGKRSDTKPYEHDFQERQIEFFMNLPLSLAGSILISLLFARSL